MGKGLSHYNELLIFVLVAIRGTAVVGTQPQRLTPGMDILMHSDGGGAQYTVKKTIDMLPPYPLFSHKEVPCCALDPI